jgi:hypothetical protein
MLLGNIVRLMVTTRDTCTQWIVLQYTLFGTSVKSTRFLFVPIVDRSSESVSSSHICNDIDNCRKLKDVIWGCITTIFACTWLTLHRNIAPPADNWDHNLRERVSHRLKRFLRHRLLPFVIALIAPEWILAWAIQQSVVANQIAIIGGKLFQSGILWSILCHELNARGCS